MRPLLFAALVLACLAASLGLPPGTRAATPVKVAIIVGPVGELTPTYLHLADAAAAAAERHGATVTRASSPHATPANVLAAVADANIVVYFGHGYGHPSPYGGLNTAKQNGWALQGPAARGTHGDAGAQVAYYGEDWIVANARPAPGFVMIYSNTCYAPGASEGGHTPATAAVAAERVAYYSRKVFSMGGSAYFATDFDRGAADLVDRLLGNPHGDYAGHFASDHRFVPWALTTQAHLFSPGQQIWLHRTKYTDGPPNYWYAFAGNPHATPIRSWDPVAPTVTLEAPEADGLDVEPWAAPQLRFSEAVTGIDAASVRLLDAEGHAVAIDLRHDAASNTVQLHPKRDLELSARYTVAIEPGPADLAGNALAPGRWSFTTRLDADPLAATLPVVLERGRHRLVRPDREGRFTKEREVALTAERRLVATARARLPGERGSWLELDGGELSGWWVVESGRARPAGVTEEVVLQPTEVVLERAPEHTLATPSDALTSPAVETTMRRERRITVDRRVVVEGRTYLRLGQAMGGDAGRWVNVAAQDVPADVVETRILERRARALPADLTLAPGRHRAFRLDESGRVVERRTLRGSIESALVTTESLIVGGASFHLLAGGRHDGWVIRDGPRVSISTPDVDNPS